MYDEKNTHFYGAKCNNDGYRIVFTRWVYDFDWSGSPEYCWKILYLCCAVGENNDFKELMIIIIINHMTQNQEALIYITLMVI